MKKFLKSKNDKFKESVIRNIEANDDYQNRLKKIACSMFEWVNLPDSMSSRYLEETLFYDGKATLLYDETKGFINTRCADSGDLNIYNLPTSYECYSFDYRTNRNVYTGFKNEELNEETMCILVMNNYDRIPTYNTIQLFCEKLAECDRVCEVNLKAQKTPILIATDKTQLLTLENVYNQYDGNQPVIWGDKELLDDRKLKVLNTEAPFVIDKIVDYKKEIWNECLSFLGINNIMIDKKERLITDEANSNNELINLNLQSFLVPRQEACKQFNKLFGLEGTDKELSVKVRSDLYNVIKKEESIINDYNHNNIDDSMEGLDE